LPLRLPGLPLRLPGLPLRLPGRRVEYAPARSNSSCHARWGTTSESATRVFWLPLEQEKKIMAMDRRSFVFDAGLSIAAIASCGMVANRFLLSVNSRVRTCASAFVALAESLFRHRKLDNCRCFFVDTSKCLPYDPQNSC
jgi:hypothetical protein